MEAESDLAVTPTAVLAFFGELALVCVLAVAGARLGDGVMSWSLAVAFPVVLVVLWGLLLAPRSSRRLRHPLRLLVQLLLVAIAAALLAVSGLAWWAAAFSVVVGGVFVVAETRAARHSRPAG